MYNQFLKYIFLIGLIAATIIRLSYGHRNNVANRRTESPLVWLLMFLWGVAQIAAVDYVLSPWLDFANYHLPKCAGMIGVVVYAIALWLLWRSHADLAGNWSATLEIRKRHYLVTHGVYRRVRHPMYAAHWL